MIFTVKDSFLWCQKEALNNLAPVLRFVPSGPFHSQGSEHSLPLPLVSLLRCFWSPEGWELLGGSPHDLSHTQPHTMPRDPVSASPTPLRPACWGSSQSRTSSLRWASLQMSTFQGSRPCLSAFLSLPSCSTGSFYTVSATYWIWFGLNHLYHFC